MAKITMKIQLEIEVEVEGKYYKGSPGAKYRWNGDPGDAPEPPEFEISEVLWQGVDITEMLNEENFDFSSLESDCIEAINNEINDND
jgi:hypothetical protein